jgi:hypothetical protein
MLEKACVQQADAYFRQIQAELDGQKASPVSATDPSGDASGNVK